MSRQRAASSPTDERIRAEGEEGGHPQQVFDPERGQYFTLNALRERVYIDPPDCGFDEHGRLKLPTE